MKNLLGALGILLALAGGLAVPGPAAAAPIDNACNTGWYVNEDEKDRKPTQAQAGLKFVGNDLVHHAIDVPVAALVPAKPTFELATGSPKPDQPSFFSVEVRNPSGAYGTLRWNPTTAKWSITIGAGTGPDGAATNGTFEHANPVALLAGKVTKWGAFVPGSNRVVSFGVGYTNSPSSAVEVTVKSVKFLGKTYNLACAPAPSASASSSASSPAPSGSASATPVAGGDVAGLPVTGPKLLATMGVGIGMVVAGALGIWASRRKRARFEAQ